MNDDKDKILQACNSFSAEELFHFVREGDITLLDLIGAGLDDGKLVGLQELMAIEEDDLWAEVQTKRTLALCRRYLQAYPNGRYAGRCTKLMLQLADAPDAPPPVSDATPEGHQPATPSAPAAPPRQEPVATEEEKLWSEVQAKRTMQLCGRYLQTYPDGRHAGECAKIIAQLMKKQNEQGKHTPAAPPGGNSRPADTSAPAKQRKQNEKPSCGLLWGSIFLALLLALLARQLATGCSDDPRPYLEEDTLQVEVLDSVSEDTTNAPISDDTNQLLYDEVKQNLLYFRDKQTWDDNTVLAVVEAGYGVTILSELILRRNPFDVEIRPLDVPAYRDIGIAMRDHETTSAAVRRFLGYLPLRDDMVNNFLAGMGEAFRARTLPGDNPGTDKMDL